LTKHRGDAALGFPGVAVLQSVFANDDDATVICCFDSGAKTSDAGPYNQAIGEELLRRGRVDIYKIPSKVRLDGHKVSTLSFLF
jgi:hypothetical protein